MNLSTDVVDYIFSFLRTDLATLKSCTQAHPRLSRLAERHLYHRTTLDIKPGYDLDITQLSSLLKKNSRIRDYIRSLAINISEDCKYLLLAWTPVTKAMSSILSSLPRLNQVTLTLSKMVWIQTHESFRSAFINILQQSSVTTVHLESIFVFPLPILSTCQNIETLSLSKCGGFGRFESTSPSLQLESLSIRSSDSLNLSSWAINHISSLTSLTIRPKPMDFSAIPRLLEACAGSLTSLELDTHDLGQSEHFPTDVDFHSNLSPESDEDDPNVLFPFTLSALSKLQHLTVRTVIRAVKETIVLDEGTLHHNSLYSEIRTIAQLIELSPPSLRQVVLKISCRGFSVIDPLIEVDWDPLLILGDSPTCPHIELCISIKESYANCEFSHEEITNTLALCPGLMRLVNLGVFSVKPETQAGD